MKKRKLKGWVWLLIGFFAGIIYSNIFIYSDLISKAQTNEKELEVQIDYPIVKVQENENKDQISEVEEYIVKCELDEVSCKIKEVADSYEVDWRLAVAISKHETWDYTSYIFKHQNNVGGLWNGMKGEFYSYDTLDNGIEAYISNLKYNYYDEGRTTIETIQPKYAPIGAKNDPNNKNESWIPGVTKYYNELVGK